MSTAEQLKIATVLLDNGIKTGDAVRIGRENVAGSVRGKRAGLLLRVAGEFRAGQGMHAEAHGNRRAGARTAAGSRGAWRHARRVRAAEAG